MSKTPKAVFDEIRKNNLLTAKMIAQAIGKSEKIVYRAISALKSLGLIERKGAKLASFFQRTLGKFSVIP